MLEYITDCNNVYIIYPSLIPPHSVEQQKIPLYVYNSFMRKMYCTAISITNSDSIELIEAMTQTTISGTNYASAALKTYSAWTDHIS